MDTLRVGIVGYGLMGKAHCYGYRVAPMLRALPVTPVVTVMSGRDAGAVAAAAAGVWRARHGHRLAGAGRAGRRGRGGHLHAARHARADRGGGGGKAVLCEKPLATSYRKAAAALAAVRRAGVLNAVGFNYRRLPALALMMRMIDEGAVGEVRLWRATWLSDEFTDPATPHDWRFDRAMGGTTISDLGCHLIDLALSMAGPVESACAQAETFFRQRPRAGGGQVPVTVDDAASALLRFESGALGSFEVARAAVRRPCDFTVEVNGSRGTLMFDYTRLNELWYAGADDDVRLYGMRRIRAEHPTHPYAAQWWPIGQGVGYGSSFANQAADLLAGWPGTPWTPGFAEGAAAQAVCEAMELSAASGRWVKVSEVLASAP